ncbi:unnamed protein product [Linum tenue]|uniref:Cyclin C-terminal domain-containing protein n=1 Tax=Linum tenue TaxID=586396 RepID=A0AAV0Q413_9ROSI|nr:unnamed protein product [Linum tenue]
MDSLKERNSKRGGGHPSQEPLYHTDNYIDAFLVVHSVVRKKLQLLELPSFFMAELCLVEHEMLKYMPKLMSSIAIYKAQCYRNGSSQ